MCKANSCIGVAIAHLTIICMPLVAAAKQSVEVPKGGEILAKTGVKGGLVVHVGCGDGRLTAALCLNERYLVHGLCANAADLEKAREHVRSLGVCGKVSIEPWSGRGLPYADNLVNLLVGEDLGGIGTDEVMRVLVPNGVAYVKKDGKWTKTVKPRPEQIDEWTHYLHDATGNAVANDSVVGPPRRLQWVGSPRWSRHHDRMASMSALVSAGGRIFYVLDEGPTASIQLPPKWVLIARDAFNGTVLWKRPIPTWHTHLWPFKSGPAQLPRRLIAVGDRVYAPLGLEAPLTALDAATGETVRTYDDTKATEEVIASDGVLFLLVNPLPTEREPYKPVHRGIGEAKRRVTRDWPWDQKERSITAIQAAAAKVLWRKQYKVVPLTLAADRQRVLFHDGEKVVCLDRRNGDVLWTSPPVSRRPSIATAFAPTLVIYKDVVLFSGGDRSMTALSAKTGEALWTSKHARSGHNCPEDLLVVDELAWSGATAGGKDSGVFTGRDLYTGEIKREFPPDVETYWFHHRCYRAKATERYILPARTGTEFVDVRSKHWEAHHWVRGGCIYGIMPCNGLIYAPPHSCACYLESKLNGFCAVAPESPARRGPEPASDDGRLERGSAYDEPITGATLAGQDDWPTYRHDAARSGFTKTSVPAELKRVWQTEIGGRLSSVVIAEGKVFLASVDTHTVHALDANSGKTVWRYTAGGRVDSPPTIYEGRALFGSADGWVYCLRASDGKLAWRFRAAPADRRLVAFEQVESVWPVHGSVLVCDDVVHCVAGRSMFLDGGLRLCRLDVKTGRKLSETVLDDRDPETGDNLQVRVRVLNMPVALPDVLSSDGRHVYMRSQRLGLDGSRNEATPAPMDPTELSALQAGEEAHLFCPTGFLDGSWFHRAYWVFGRSFSSGCNWYFRAGRYAPAGRILAFDDASVYGYGRKPQYFQWTTPLDYRLFATSKDIPRVEAPSRRGKGGGSKIRVAKSESLNPAGSPLTVEAWVKAEHGDGVVLARGGASHGYALIVRGGKPRFVIRVKEDVKSVGAKEKIVGKWVHLAGVLTDDKKLQIYVNGKISGTGKAGGFIAADPHQPMDIGADEGSTVGAYKAPFRFTGVIDEVRIYHRALTADQIAKHHAPPGQAAGEEADLVLCYSFDKGDAADDSGNKNDGVITGAESVQGKSGKAMKFVGKERSVPSVIKCRWVEEIPLHVRAMVLAGKTLFIAGPPDLIDEEEVFKGPDDPALREKLEEQVAALEGKQGALLWAVSTTDGKKTAAYEIESSPAWDGMAAAGGRLYLSTTSGQVLCMGVR